MSLLGMTTCVPEPESASRETRGTASVTTDSPETPPATREASSPTFSLPLAKYSFTATQHARIQAAENALLNACVRRFGIVARAPVHDASAPQPSDRRYGLVRLREAESDGYHLPTRNAPEKRTRIDDDLMLVLHGTTNPQAPARTATPSRPTLPVLHGRQIPKGGCTREANDRIHAPFAHPEGSEIASLINSRANQESSQDARLRAVFTRWSSCMKSSGFSYATPLEAMSDHRFLGPAVSSLERRTAVADVMCKESVQLPRVWLSVESEKQQPLIQKHRKSLDKLHLMHQRKMKAVDDILATAAVR
ncbi:hypothetical protein [Streptomyces gardneri]|uniref:hypothetical protein n=1 Tax=Streptomyces gardneri TaxID=66892 RepID=UPI00114220B4|nr:hypothetical protein [Streptomyces gardneri]